MSNKCNQNDAPGLDVGVRMSKNLGNKRIT